MRFFSTWPDVDLRTWFEAKKFTFPKRSTKKGIFLLNLATGIMTELETYLANAQVTFFVHGIFHQVARDKYFQIEFGKT